MVTVLYNSYNRKVVFFPPRHMVEIHDLHLRQKGEIDALFSRLGRSPPSVVAPPTMNMSGGRRRITKGKNCKSGKSVSAQASPQHTGMSGSHTSYSFDIFSPVEPASGPFHCLGKKLTGQSGQAPASVTTVGGTSNNTTTTTTTAFSQSAPSQSKSQVFLCCYFCLKLCFFFFFNVLTGCPQPF